MPLGNWSASNFDHSTTAFPLEGRHAEIDCKDCHKPMVVNNEVITNTNLNRLSA
ncbi:MAG: hypothetical protein R2784_18675 [Saprospiraceae bacterium]